jgi:hypothetical protein
LTWTSDWSVVFAFDHFAQRLASDFEIIATDYSPIAFDFAVFGRFAFGFGVAPSFVTPPQ